MRNFFLLIRKYNFFIVFLLLEVASGILLVRNSTYQRAALISTSNELVGKVYTAYSNVTDYLVLGETNRILSAENARLRRADSVSFYDPSFRVLRVNDTIGLQQYEYISARVVNNSVSRVNNYITLDKGSLQGIQPEMAVMGSNGVVGIVKDVSEHFSTVISLLHSSTKISSKIKKNDYFGSAVWDGENPQIAKLLDIPSHAQVKVGDTIVTSSYSGIFPRDILVGIVSGIGTSGESFKEIKLKLATDFQKLSYVYVVRNLLKSERDTLEANTLVVQ
jgi:rod shape-determining protein MreC